MSLALSLFPDIDGLDQVIAESELVLQTWLWALAILLAFVVFGNCIERAKLSPVEKMLRRRGRV